MNDTTTNSSESNTAIRPEDKLPHRYGAKLANKIEEHWQKRWEADKVFRMGNPGEPGFDANKPKFFCMDMFPYPSGAGLHVGHPEGYTATDIVSRFKRLTGHNVLHPMGFDAFGLPAEQYAIATGINPAITTRKAIITFREQLKRFGFCYDWSREFATIDEDYYKWTQWIWLKAYNSWYDTNPRNDKARPIEELIAEFRSGERKIRYDPDCPTGLTLGGSRDQQWSDWDSISKAEQADILNTYRLVYLGFKTVNWCPKLGTALANEEVIDGKSERGGFPVFRKHLKQWMFRITSYADRLLKGLDGLDWPESTRTMQQQWIGRSEGANVDFPIIDPPKPDSFHTLRVYTTRPDTLFGATYMVIAPEHELVQQIIENPATATDVDKLKAYVETATKKSDVDRMADAREKTGVATGFVATNPATGQDIPIWVADYVLMGYGTGAIMAVPGQDQRDWDFAKAFDLPIVRTVQPPDGFEGEAFVEDGPAINSEFLDGLQVNEAKATMIAWLKKENHGEGTVQFKLRDWLFSRQRYWGEPFPIVFDEQGNHYPVMDSKLPVVLPPMENFSPEESDEPKPLLGKATEWVNTTAGEAGVDPKLLAPSTPVKRETNTMPNWAGSCWYYLRYCAPGCKERFTSREAEAYWMGENGVDLYIGGAEHAVLHLLYARFWHMILHDLGEVETTEPFKRLFHQGMITSFAYQREDKTLAPVNEVRDDEEGNAIEVATGKPVVKTIAKMSKSLHNVINPDDVIAEYGADTFRLYEMYMGPLGASIPWNPRDIVGVFRFLQRVWRLVVNEESGELNLQAQIDDEVERALHRTIAKVANDIDKLAMNTAIASMIEFTNLATSKGGLTKDQLERFAITMSPFVPHIAEELWHKLGRVDTITDASWPTHDESMLQDDEIEIPVQIMGKVRARITMPKDSDQEAIEEAALNNETIKAQLEGKTVRKIIVVKGKIVNIVAN
ncbi:MAG: leucine--tRNA ligase [Planctomycetota bacterium]|nr:leucine--tRNA ligase [Planctomycetota bacterium]